MTHSFSTSHFFSTLSSVAIRFVITSLAVCLVGAFVGVPAASAQNADSTAEEGSAAPILEQVEAPYICMITNKVFDSKQIEVPVAGRTYYGCCQMCVETLNGEAESRYAVDPVSRMRVNKADAILGAGLNGTVHYFESVENLRAFNPSSVQESGDGE